MPDTKISALPSGSPAQAGDQFPIARNGNNYSLTTADINTYGIATANALPSGAPAQSTDNVPILRSGVPYKLTVGNIISSMTTVPAGSVTDASLATSSQIYAIDQTFNKTTAETSAGVTITNYGYPPLNPLRYGADPTGTADSTTALQAAINVAQAGGGGVINLPVGNCKHTGLTLTGAVGVWIQGTWETILTNTGTGVGITVGNTSASQTADVRLIGFLLVGNASSSHGIHMKRMQSALIQYVRTRNNGGDGFRMEGCYASKILDSYTNNNTGNGIYTLGLAGVGCDFMQILRNYCLANGAKGIYIDNTLYGPSGMRVEMNDMEGNAIGFQIDVGSTANTESFTFRGNYQENNSGSNAVFGNDGGTALLNSPWIESNAFNFGTSTSAVNNVIIGASVRQLNLVSNDFVTSDLVYNTTATLGIVGGNKSNATVPGGFDASGGVTVNQLRLYQQGGAAYSAMSMSGGYVRQNFPQQWAGAVFPASANTATYQTTCGLWAGTGVPSNTYGSDGNFYFRSDVATTNPRIYYRSGGSWANIGVSYDVIAAETTAGITPSNLMYPPLNILRYGADPTGVASSSTALTSALSVASALNGGTIIVPNGTYSITAAVPITSDAITIQGAGPLKGAPGGSTTGATVFVLGANDLFQLNANRNQVSLRDFGVYSNNASSGHMININTSQITCLSISGVYTFGVNSAIYANGASAVIVGMWVQNCEFAYDRSWHVDYASGATQTNVNFINCKFEAQSAAVGHFRSVSSLTEHKFINCVFESGLSQYALSLGVNVNAVEFIGCHFENNGGAVANSADVNFTGGANSSIKFSSCNFAYPSASVTGFYNIYHQQSITSLLIENCVVVGQGRTGYVGFVYYPSVGPLTLINNRYDQTGTPTLDYLAGACTPVRNNDQQYLTKTGSVMNSVVKYLQTANATATAIWTGQYLWLSGGGVVYVVADIIASDSTGATYFSQTIRRAYTANAALTTITAVGGTTSDSTAITSGGTLAVAMTTTTQGVIINVTGVAATTINWVANIRITKSNF